MYQCFKIDSESHSRGRQIDESVVMNLFMWLLYNIRYNSKWVQRNRSDMSRKSKSKDLEDIPNHLQRKENFYQYPRSLLCIKRQLWLNLNYLNCLNGLKMFQPTRISTRNLLRNLKLISTTELSCKLCKILMWCRWEKTILSNFHVHCTMFQQEIL